MADATSLIVSAVLPKGLQQCLVEVLVSRSGMLCDRLPVEQTMFVGINIQAAKVLTVCNVQGLHNFIGQFSRLQKY